jgi:hypothetical protein
MADLASIRCGSEWLQFATNEGSRDGEGVTVSAYGMDHNVLV